MCLSGKFCFRSLQKRGTHGTPEHVTGNGTSSKNKVTVAALTVCCSLDFRMSGLQTSLDYKKEIF